MFYTEIFSATSSEEIFSCAEVSRFFTVTDFSLTSSSPIINAKLCAEEDMAILLISHDLEQVKKYADKVILLNKKILKMGTVDEVFKN